MSLKITRKDKGGSHTSKEPLSQENLEEKKEKALVNTDLNH